MSLANKTNFLSKYLKDLAIFLKYSIREKLFLFFAVALYVLGSWFKSLDLTETLLSFLTAWQFHLFLGFCAITIGFVLYVGYRFLLKISLVRPVEEKALASSIKGLMAFTDDDNCFYV